ncbi:MAG TPA: hypothetical protein VNZ45_11005 [Bacteroidia bacterium]|nr:hypothetical protein [Bacteroidia bacterium]
MRKSTFLFILGSVVCFTSSAQKESTVNTNVPYIELTGGVGVPLGEFGGKSGSSIGEFAQVGMAWNIAASYPVCKRLHAILNAGDNYNKFNLSAYVAQLPEGGTLTNVAISATAYNAGNILAGLGYAFTSSDKLSIDIKVAGGALFFSSPDVQYYKIGGRGDYDILSACRISFAIKPGMDVVYNLSSKLNCLLDLGVLYSSFTISSTLKTGYAPLWSYYTSSQSMKVTIFEANIGIAYKFGK